MSAMVNQWTGDGLADGTAVTAGNVTTAGNVSGSGVTWARNASGTPVMNTAGHGLAITGADADIGRIDATITTPQPGVRMQFKLTRGPISSSSGRYLEWRTGSASLGYLLFDIDSVSTGGIVNIPGANPVSGTQWPDMTPGDVFLVDAVAALHSSPTTSNGRFFFRIKNLTNTSWNTSGEFFADTLYTVNLGTTNPSVVRFGKVTGALMTGTPSTFEFLGADPVTVAITDTSAAAAKAYFADTPAVNTPLATPVVTLSSVSHPTTTGGTDGSATVTWAAVANAHHYEAGIASGDVTVPTTVVSTAATSPFTFTGLNAGVKSLFIKAKAS